MAKISKSGFWRGLDGRLVDEVITSLGGAQIGDLAATLQQLEDELGSV